MRHCLITCMMFSVTMLLGTDAALADSNGPVRVFLMAGQSNMQGHGKVEVGNGGVVGAIGSLRYQVNNDPANYGQLGDGAGHWNTRNDVWVWNRQGTANQPGDWTTSGYLTTGFGASSSEIGPELGFGYQAGDYHDSPVVLVKTAWGGASLAVDFRPPTAVSNRGGSVGESYNRMLSSYQEALTAITAQYPGRTIALSGFVWHQGWNDRVSNPYNAEYEANLTDFIGDVRNDLGAANLPFVLATTSMGGDAVFNPALYGGRPYNLEKAQLNIGDPLLHPEFVGNVAVVNSRSFWRDSSASPTAQDYHWNGNGESQYLIGKGLGDAYLSLIPEPTSLALLGLGGLMMLKRR